MALSTVNTIFLVVCLLMFVTLIIVCSINIYYYHREQNNPESTIPTMSNTMWYLNIFGILIGIIFFIGILIYTLFKRSKYDKIGDAFSAIMNSAKNRFSKKEIIDAADKIAAAGEDPSAAAAALSAAGKDPNKAGLFAKLLAKFKVMWGDYLEKREIIKTLSLNTGISTSEAKDIYERNNKNYGEAFIEAKRKGSIDEVMKRTGSRKGENDERVVIKCLMDNDWDVESAIECVHQYVKDAGEKIKADIEEEKRTREILAANNEEFWQAQQRKRIQVNANKLASLEREKAYREEEERKKEENDAIEALGKEENEKESNPINLEAMVDRSTNNPIPVDTSSIVIPFEDRIPENLANDVSEDVTYISKRSKANKEQAFQLLTENLGDLDAAVMDAENLYGKRVIV